MDRTRKSGRIEGESQIRNDLRDVGVIVQVGIPGLDKAYGLSKKQQACTPLAAVEGAE